MNKGRNRVKFDHPEWSYRANIYEVNLRQYTPEGTFNAFAKELPRLADMGVKILWFMPVTPISLKDRQGSLGSYYAVSDYKAVNPEYGTLEDFKSLISYAHSLGFKVIVDFVGNHTGNDHHWILEHPEFYFHQEDGSLLHPHGWKDVAQLNFQEKGVWEALADAMAFWVSECDVDGFRCDMAHLVPLDLWYEARVKLESIKPGQFWLAECEEPEYHQVFDATYTWKWMHATEKFFRGEVDFGQMLLTLFASNVEFDSSGFRSYFTSNHDENSWNGTEYEKYGDAVGMFAVFSCTWNSIPLIYSGQELPNLKRLKFFDKDSIEWTGTCNLHDFYKTLLSLRSRNAALGAGDRTMTKLVDVSGGNRILTYLRKCGDDEVLTVLNCSGEDQTLNLKDVSGPFRNVFGGPDIQFPASVFISRWGYLVFEKKDA